jgi:hypothetical protein
MEIILYQLLKVPKDMLMSEGGKSGSARLQCFHRQRAVSALSSVKPNASSPPACD